jgi:hypothetical protein
MKTVRTESMHSLGRMAWIGCRPRDPEACDDGPSSTILAVDLGKFNSLLCWYHRGTRGAETTPEVPRRALTRR